MAETRSNAPSAAASAAGNPYDEEINNIYQAQMGNSRAMNATGQRSLNPSAVKAKATPQPVPSSLQEKPKISQVPAKPKISLINNRNKHDHIQQLLCGVNKPAAADAAPKKPTTATSQYRMNYVFEEEAKEMIAGVDQTHNFKRTFDSNYANEFIKMKGNLRLL